MALPKARATRATAPNQGMCQDSRAGKLTDELVGQVAQIVTPVRPGGHGGRSSSEGPSRRHSVVRAARPDGSQDPRRALGTVAAQRARRHTMQATPNAEYELRAARSDASSSARISASSGGHGGRALGPGPAQQIGPAMALGSFAHLPCL